MTRTVNGKRGAAVATVLQEQNRPVPLVTLLEQSLAQVRIRKLSAALRDSRERPRGRK